MCMGWDVCARVLDCPCPAATTVCDCLLFFKAQPTADVSRSLEDNARRLREQQAVEAAESSRQASGASDAAPLSTFWLSRIQRMPPYVRLLLGYNVDPSTVWPLGLLLEQTNGTAIDTLTKFRNAVQALERPPEHAVLRVKSALTPKACAQVSVCP